MISIVSFTGAPAVPETVDLPHNLGWDFFDRDSNKQ